MNVSEYLNKWNGNTCSERSASEEHFLDLSALLGHGTHNEDATGESFAFEPGVTRRGKRVGQGWSDGWKRGFSGWEY